MPAWHWQAECSLIYGRLRVSKEFSLLGSEQLPLWHFVVAHNYQYCFTYTAFITWHGCAFIFEDETKLLDKRGVYKYTCLFHVLELIFMWIPMCKESNSGILCLLSVLQTGMAVQQEQSWTRAKILLNFCTLCQFCITKQISIDKLSD